MKSANEIRVGNVLKIDGKIAKVISQEIKGSGKVGKTVHLKLKTLEDGHMMERGIRSEERVEEVDVHRVKMQYLYKDQDQFVFMNMESYEQFQISATTVGKQEVFLKENDEIDVLFGEERALIIDFPKTAELSVVNAPPAVKGGSDSTYKEVELENGLQILVPQFIKEGDRIRLSIDDLSYVDRVTKKSMG